MEEKKDIIVITFLLLFTLTIPILFLNELRTEEKTYCTVTYKVYYPNETITKTKSYLYKENQEPRVVSRKGSDRLKYGCDVLEQTTAPIEIIDVYCKKTKKN